MPCGGGAHHPRAGVAQYGAGDWAGGAVLRGEARLRGAGASGGGGGGPCDPAAGCVHGLH